MSDGNTVRCRDEWGGHMASEVYSGFCVSLLSYKASLMFVVF